MPYRVTNGAGTSFNTAANWDTGVNTPSIHASTNITVTSGGVFSATFTAPNTVNAATGVVVPVAAKGTAGTITATLQENSAGWVDKASVTINITSLVASTPVFFEFTAAYTFTSTAAGYYRIKLNTTGAAGTTSIAADSGAANFSYLATYNSNAVPTAGDDVLFISPNQGVAHVMDVDASFSFGSGTNTSVPDFRSWGNAITLANNGGFSFPVATSRTITYKGNILHCSGGIMRIGTTAAPIQTGITARMLSDQNGTSCNYGWKQLNGGVISLQAQARSYRKTTLSSGVGTAADPAIMSDPVDWSVGDEVCIVPTSNNATNYDETETRFIIMKNSSTSYVWSSTAGGAETALTYTHTNAPVFNLTYSIVFDTTDTTKAWYCDFNEITSVSNIDMDGVRFETTGSSTTSRTSLVFSNLSTEKFTCDDCCFYRQLGTNGVRFGENNEVRTYTWLVFFDCNATGNAGAAFLGSIRNKRYENCYVIDSQSRGFYCAANSASYFISCGAWACGRTTTTSGAFGFQNVAKVYLESCDIHANRSAATELSSAVDIKVAQCNLGTKGTNSSGDVYVSSDGYDTALFEDCMFGSATLISNYLNASAGTEIAFHNHNQTDNTHFWYTNYGSGQPTGAGLSDTTVYTPGSLACRLSPESTEGQTMEFHVLARAGRVVNVFGLVKKNAAHSADEVSVDLYLPGSLTPDDTYIMPNDTNWNLFDVGALYSGTIDLYARVVITAKSATAGAYAYIDDILNGTNELTALDVWFEGKPSPVMYEELGDAAAVWAVPRTGNQTAGTFGEGVLIATDGVDADALATSAVNEIAAAIPSAASVADAVWDEALADHTASGTTGEMMNDNLDVPTFMGTK